MSNKLKLKTIKLETADGKTVELSLAEAKDLHDQLHELFGTKYVPSVPVVDVEIETSKLPDAPAQRVGEADPDTAAGHLRDRWMRDRIERDRYPWPYTPRWIESKPRLPTEPWIVYCAAKHNSGLNVTMCGDAV